MRKFDVRQSTFRTVVVRNQRREFCILPEKLSFHALCPTWIQSKTDRQLPKAKAVTEGCSPIGACAVSFILPVTTLCGYVPQF